MIEENHKSFILESLKEDIGKGDQTSISSIPKWKRNKAHLLVKDKGIIAGVELAKMIFHELDKKLHVETNVKDGDNIKNGDIVLVVEGLSISILQAERLVLNCMQRMSGIATQTSEYCKLLKGTNTKLLDTRKTTPLNRKLERWAVRIGGGMNHRFNLNDVILIKDNHIDLAGGIKNALENTHEYLKKEHKKINIIIESRNIKEIKEIISIGGVNRIILDNFNLKETKKAVQLLKGRYPTESSGKINKENIRDYAKCGVDFISVGALTHSVRNIDLSLKTVS